MQSKISNFTFIEHFNHEQYAPFLTTPKIWARIIINCKRKYTHRFTLTILSAFSRHTDTHVIWHIYIHGKWLVMPNWNYDNHHIIHPTLATSVSFTIINGPSGTVLRTQHLQIYLWNIRFFVFHMPYSANSFLQCWAIILSNDVCTNKMRKWIVLGQHTDTGGGGGLGKWPKWILWWATSGETYTKNSNLYIMRSHLYVSAAIWIGYIYNSLYNPDKKKFNFLFCGYHWDIKYVYVYQQQRRCVAATAPITQVCVCVCVGCKRLVSIWFIQNV